MKEFQTKKGGRVLYNEDFHNLQELIDSSVSFFRSAGTNFVISGCVPDADGNVSGYVFLDDKIRKLEKTSMTGMITPAIVPLDTTYTDIYEDGNESPIMYNYGCKMIDLAKESPISSKIIWDKTIGFGNVFDSFLSNFVALKSSKKTQNIHDDVKFRGYVNIEKAILCNSTVNFVSTELSDGSIKFATTSASNRWIIITPDGNITFHRMSDTGDDEVVFAMTDEDNSCTLDVNSASVFNLNSKVLKAESINGNREIRDKAGDITDIVESTEWYNIIDRSNGQKVQNLRCRLYRGVVYIQGELPIDFCHISRLNNVSGVMISNYGLPDEIPLPKYGVEFDVSSPLVGGVGITVKIMNANPFMGRFYFDSDALPKSDDSTIPSKYNLLYVFSPCVAWQYMYKFENKFQFNTERTEEFLAYSYRYREYKKFIAYNKITFTLTNNNSGKVYKNVRWEEAVFVGAVHRNDQPGNYCSNMATKNEDGTYQCDCTTGTLYFRSALDSNKLYSQTWFEGESPILAGVITPQGYDCSVSISKSNGVHKLQFDKCLVILNPKTDRFIIHCGFKELETKSGKATDDVPPLYIDTIESPRDFEITSGGNLFTLVNDDKRGNKTYAVSDFDDTRQITIAFPNSNFTFYIRKE